MGRTSLSDKSADGAETSRSTWSEHTYILEGKTFREEETVETHVFRGQQGGWDSGRGVSQGRRSRNEVGETMGLGSLPW